MILFAHPDAGLGPLAALRDGLRALGIAFDEVRLDGRAAFVLQAETVPVPVESLERLPAVERAVAFGPVAPLAEAVSRTTAVELGPARFGGGSVSIIAGPCTVEDPAVLARVGRLVRDAGATALRGGAFKVRTSPYAYQGGGKAAVAALAAAAREVGLPYFTELTDPRQVEEVGELLDGIQIGARHMQNVPLLVEAARTGKPVLLKRHPGADVDEWLLAAEYCLREGDARVLLCERGVRAPGRHVRYLLDVGVVPYLKERTGLPVVVDPSHAAGRHELVPALARAAVAAGADGLIVEVHPEPETTRCDARQALPPAALAALVDDVRRIVAIDARTLAAPPTPEGRSPSRATAAGM